MSTESPTIRWWARWRWIVRAVALLAVAVVGWACVSQWGAVVHGHPAYAVLLVVTVLAAFALGLRTLRRAPRKRRLPGRIVLAALAVGWIALIGWLCPMSAVEPALAAMRSDSAVTVTETPTQIVLAPTTGASTLGVFFQPGAKVDARAYAAVLHPLAAAGYTVVIPKQPLGIAFLAIGAFESSTGSFPHITRWVVGGHSLGGTVAAMEADSGDHDAHPVVGLLLYASYPANDIRGSLTAKVLSISGSRDGLATQASITASKADLPAASEYVTIAGGVHAYFGDYGQQPGDGTPTISHTSARTQITAATLEFLKTLAQ